MTVLTNPKPCIELNPKARQPSSNMVLYVLTTAAAAAPTSIDDYCGLTAAARIGIETAAGRALIADVNEVKLSREAPAVNRGVTIRIVTNKVVAV
jgi:TusA-related sulfurtransferase